MGRKSPMLYQQEYKGQNMVEFRDAFVWRMPIQRAKIAALNIARMDYIFVILSLKHRVYSAKNAKTGLYVTLTKRTAWEFCQILDRKVIKSKKGFPGWLDMAKSNEWIKTDE